MVTILAKSDLVRPLLTVLTGGPVPPLSKNFYISYFYLIQHENIIKGCYYNHSIVHICINLFYKCDYPSAYPSLLP